MADVVIVIPVYQEELSAAEQVSLRQVRRVLGRYPICFMAPERMRGVLSANGEKAVYFPDSDFDGRLAYSKLLLSPRFYERFQAYRYLLIYQLDAFVFKDTLSDFCRKEYDYWGAPMPFSYWEHVHANIGNGGLSLRNVQKCIEVTRQKELIYQQTGLQAYFEGAEDRFFAYCGKSPAIDFRVPRVREALEFSMEFDVAHAWRRLPSPALAREAVIDRLPFGCHAWSKAQYFPLWRKYLPIWVPSDQLQMLERELANPEAASYRAREKKRYTELLMERMADRSPGWYRNLQRRDPFWSQAFVLWGAGYIGNRVREQFLCMGMKIAYVFDRSLKGNIDGDDGICSCPPDDEVLKGKRYKIIITTERYYAEIKRHMEQLGLSEDKDFFFYLDLEKILVQMKYGSIWEKMRDAK